MSIEELNSKEDLMRFIRESLEGEPLSMGSIEGLQQAVTPGKWEPLVLENGWSNSGAPNAGAAYRTIPGGGIQLRGLVSKTEAANGTTIATLPPAARPKAEQNLVFGMGGIGEVGFGYLFLVSTGIISCQTATAGAIQVSLTDVIFWPGT